MTATHTTVDSPLGTLTLVAADGVLCGVYFPVHRHQPEPAAFGARTEHGFEEARRQLAEYFGGSRTAFDLPTSGPATAAAWTASGGCSSWRLRWSDADTGARA